MSSPVRGSGRTGRGLYPGAQPHVKEPGVLKHFEIGGGHGLA